MGWTALAVFGLATMGCEPAEVTCGPGTVLSGDTCVPDSMGMMMGDPPPTGGGTDAGAPMMDPPPPPPPSGGSDAGPGWSSTDPMAPPPEPGCEGTECGEWADTLVELIASHDGRGCADEVMRPEGMQAVADRHAQHQAGIDMLDASSPDGDLFTQVRDSGVRFMYAGALFSVGNRGAADVMDRWVDGDDTRGVLDQCWTMVGVSFATGESGYSYATVLLAR